MALRPMLHQSAVERSSAARRWVLTTAVAGVAVALPRLFPGFEDSVLVGGSARLAGFLTGSPVIPVDGGWALPAAGSPVHVTRACSAADFWAILSALVAWRSATLFRSVAVAAVGALPAALVLTLLTNAVRVVAVATAHRWVIPQFPDSYGAVLHLLTGMAVFLPALALFNLLLQSHVLRRFASFA